MEWYTTAQASNALKISGSRVRQLISKYKNESDLIRKKKKNSTSYYLVSDLFISKVQESRNDFKTKLLSVGEKITQPDGTIVQVVEVSEFEKLMLENETLSEQYAELSERFDEALSEQYAEALSEPIKVGEPTEQPDGTIIEAFTPDQYHDFEKKLTEYHQIKKDLTQIEQRFKEHIADLKEQIEDLKQQRNFLQKSLEVQQKETGNLLQVVQQRNFIEATEKKVS